MNSPQAKPSHPAMGALIVAISERRDREAFATLFNHFAPRVKSYLLRLGAGPESAEELAQETLLTVWRRAGAYDPDRAAASTWIFTIARNLRIDLARRNRRPAPTEDPFSDLEGPVPPEAAFGAVQDAERVAIAVSALSVEQSEVIKLAFFSDKPHSEIAADLGIPLGTVKSRLRLAMAKLRGLLGGEPMTPRYHPSEERLLDHGAGILDSGPGLVIATHLRACSACAAKVRLIEAVGGVLLEDLPPADLQRDALALALARLDRPATDIAHAAPAQRLDWIDVPPIVLEAARRRRRWAAPGVWVAPVTGVASGARTYLLRVGAGMSVPRHTHRGAEMVCVLKGAYADRETIHGQGDFAENDDNIDHTPTVTPDGECICLIFADGRLVPRDWVGRIFQPMVRI